MTPRVAARTCSGWTSGRPTARPLPPCPAPHTESFVSLPRPLLSLLSSSRGVRDREDEHRGRNGGQVRGREARPVPAGSAPTTKGECSMKPGPGGSPRF